MNEPEEQSGDVLMGSDVVLLFYCAARPSGVRSCEAKPTCGQSLAAPFVHLVSNAHNAEMFFFF